MPKKTPTQRIHTCALEGKKLFDALASTFAEIKNITKEIEALGRYREIVDLNQKTLMALLPLYSLRPDNCMREVIEIETGKTAMASERMRRFRERNQSKKKLTQTAQSFAPWEAKALFTKDSTAAGMEEIFNHFQADITEEINILIPGMPDEEVLPVMNEMREKYKKLYETEII